MLQHTDEWWQARLGKVTASRIVDVCARTKSGWGASRANYLAELVAERLTGEAEEGFQNAAMIRGGEMEAEAKTAYAFEVGAPVVDCGFIPHPAIDMAGASPDCFVGDEGLAEFKCPNVATHIKYLLGGTIDKKYRDQMQFQMDCTGRRWCDFVSYAPRMPVSRRLCIRRVDYDEQHAAEVLQIVKDFLQEVDEVTRALS